MLHAVKTYSAPLSIFGDVLLLLRLRRGAAGNELGTTIKYLRQKTSGAAGICLVPSFICTYVQIYVQDCALVEMRCSVPTDKIFSKQRSEPALVHQTATSALAPRCFCAVPQVGKMREARP